MKDATKAEIIWVLRTTTKHLSYNSNQDIAEILKLMFPDSLLAQAFGCGPDKISYIAKYGIALYFKQELKRIVHKGVPLLSAQIK